MVRFASRAVLLSFCAFSLEPSPRAGTGAVVAGSYQLPLNVQVSGTGKQAIAELVVRSPTLREQCERIAAARHVRVTIELVTPSTLNAQMRARATARRYESGLLSVLVELPISSDLAELLAHELEHVIELIDRVDLRMMARERRGGVTQQKLDGAYETQRARDAGRAAAAETYAPDPSVLRLGRAVSKSVRNAWRFLMSAPRRPAPGQ